MAERVFPARRLQTLRHVAANDLGVVIINEAGRDCQNTDHQEDAKTDHSALVLLEPAPDLLHHAAALCMLFGMLCRMSFLLHL